MQSCESPVTYQGGKTRVAGSIVDCFWADTHGQRFYDICCGSGAISIEMINRGFPVSDIRMIDAGPWGIFWQSVGDGTFSLEKFRSYVNSIPSDLDKVSSFMKELSQQSASRDTAEVFLILQAASFGGKAIWIKGDKWVNNSFRSYWTPTENSSRRSPVNPMMPMPDTILTRLEKVLSVMGGKVTAKHGDAMQMPHPRPNSIVYIDPPYISTTGYGHNLNYIRLVEKLQEVDVYVSEGIAISDEAILISSGRSKGGISGTKKVASNLEYLSIFRKRVK